MKEILVAFFIMFSITGIALFTGLKLAGIEGAEPSIEIIHPVESIRCVSQDSKIVFCESYRISE